MPEDLTTRITSAEAIPLAYALTARVAEDAGVRLIALKGVVLAHHGLRDPRISSDIDMLLHPDDLDRYLEAIAPAGWRVAAEASTPKILGHHSVDLLNDHWPIGVDLHTFFPGFLAPAGEVFDVLWERRVTLTQAGHPMYATDLSSSAAVAALHHLRSMWRPENQNAFDLLVGKASERLSEPERDDLVELARATGSVLPLAPFFEALGIEAGAPVHLAEEKEWGRWYEGTHAHPYMAWWSRFKRLKPWQWPGFLWHAIMLTPEEMRAYHGDQSVDTPVWKLRLLRIVRVLRAVPSTLRHELRRRRNPD